jgi:mono/diheme cytochrome c family protein
MKNTFRLAPLVCLLSLCFSAPAIAADAAAGRALAEKWCTKCHDIEAGAPFKLHPPSFAAIAAFRPAEVIHSKIVSPHIGMPEIIWTLQAEDIENVEAYIASLGAAATP